MAPFTPARLNTYFGPVELTPLTASHLDAIYQLEHEGSTYPWNRANFINSINSSHRCLGLIQQGTLLAHAIISINPFEAELLLITVAKQAQGKGLGRLLLNTVIHQLSGKVHDLFLEVRSNNQRAIGLYESLGFNQLGVRKNYYPDGENALVYGLFVG